MRVNRQKGFTLLELSITTVLMTMGIVAMIQMQSHQAQLEVARSVAQIYERLNNAAGSYMSTFYDDLIGLDPECSRLNAKAGAPPANIGAPACNINLTINGRSRNVVNGLQPTPQELAQLGMLGDAGGVEYVNGLPLPVHPVGSNLSAVDSLKNPVPRAFGIIIQFMCIGQANDGAVVFFRRQDCQNVGGGAVNRNVDLRSLVLNLQPYNLENSRAGGVLLDQILLSAGGNAYLSDMDANGELRGQNGSAVPTIINPMRWAKDKAPEHGAPYVLAMSNGFGSSGYSQMLRRNGTQTLTAAWDVGNQSITGITDLGAVNGNFSGNVTADGALVAGTLESRGGITAKGDISGVNLNASGNVSGINLNASGNVTAKGNVSGVDITGTGLVKGQTGVFGNFVANVEAALKATSAYISGALTVAGDFTSLGKNLFKGEFTSEGVSRFTGQLTATGKTELEGDTTAYKFRLGSSAILGGACNPNVETLRRAEAGGPDATVKLLVCDPGGTWVRAQADYAASISGINSSITGISGAITNINGSITGINEVAGSLDVRVTANKTEIDALKVDVAQLKATTSSISDDVTLMKSGVKQLEGQVMKWDLLNVVWRPASCTGTTCTAVNKVWKKTPWKCSDFNAGGGGLPEYSAGENVRWLPSASDVQKAVAGASATPPIFVGLDDVPGEFTVYDVNCGTPNDTGDSSGSYWYVGISDKANNEANGNKCRSGLGSVLTPATATMSTYNGGAYGNSNCKNFNVLAPSFNKRLMQARFIAFTNKL